MLERHQPVTATESQQIERRGGLLCGRFGVLWAVGRMENVEPYDRRDRRDGGKSSPLGGGYFPWLPRLERQKDYI